MKAVSVWTPLRLPPGTGGRRGDVPVAINRAPYCRSSAPDAVTIRDIAAPNQLLYVIRENHETGERTLDLLRWGLIPHCCVDPDGGRKPINARAETVARLPTFRAAYALVDRTHSA
jgi:putative SOS response-associated peptidase YedK